MYERGMAALKLKMPEKIPHTEYCYNPNLVKTVTGIDPDEPGKGEKAYEAFFKAVDYDLLWSAQIHDEVFGKGRRSRMGSARYSADQELKEAEYAFHSIEEIYSLDPVNEYGLADSDKTTSIINQRWHEKQKRNQTMVVMGEFYNTIFTWCIRCFGWELFMEAAQKDMRRFAKVLEGFFHVSLSYFEAYARSDVETIICHDDIVWSSGPVFHPEWYRRYIFPYYPRLWEPLKQAGKTVLFCSDGNYSEFIDDIAQAGADGFFLEPFTSLEKIVKKYRKTKVIVGNVDTRILTFGTREEIRKEVKRCYKLGKDCPGYFIAVGNHIPYNVPIDNALYYLELVQNLKR